jgi:putative endonuclease
MKASGDKSIPAQWHVYIVRCSDGTLYTGVTNDVDTRVAAHNAGRGAKYTRTRLPVLLVYAEPAGARGDALRREHQIKQMTRQRKGRLIVTQFAGSGGG